MTGSLRAEFERQVENLLRKGYPDLAGVNADVFAAQIAPLRDRLGDLRPSGNESRIPFAIVVTSNLVATASAITRIELEGNSGFIRMDPTEPEDYRPIDGVDVPPPPAYLVGDVDTGEATLNVTPDDALGAIARQGRSPLTIDEGIAVITHYPDTLHTKNCFSILGSRRGDRRVPALWISGGRPRLGWCWAGNPHSWLGSASCGSRLGA